MKFVHFNHILMESKCIVPIIFNLKFVKYTVKYTSDHYKLVKKFFEVWYFQYHINKIKNQKFLFSEFTKNN